MQVAPQSGPFPETGSRNRSRRVGLLLLLLLLGTPPPWISASPASAAEPPLTVVPVGRAEPQNGYTLEQVFIGRVEARRSAALGFERGGLLTEVLVQEGDRVDDDAVLARLDRSLLLGARDERVAEAERAEAELALAEATAGRYRDSVADGAVTKQSLDEARQGARTAEAQLRLARARIATVDLDLAKTELRAPFPGTVIRMDADPGTVLGAGQSVLMLQESATPEVRIGVAGPLVSQLAADAEYRLEINRRPVTARLRAILPLRTGSSLTVDALFDPILEPSGQAGARAAPSLGEAAGGRLLRPGDPAELRLSKPISAPGFWLPLTALAEGRRGLWRALVVEPESESSASATPSSEIRGRLVSRPLQVLHVDAARAYVQGSLARGDLVVEDGLHRVVPGQVVGVRERPDAAEDGRVDRASAVIEHAPGDGER
jgi:RND family efflux transporter MFP subunit